MVVEDHHLLVNVVVEGAMVHLVVLSIEVCFEIFYSLHFLNIEIKDGLEMQ